MQNQKRKKTGWKIWCNELEETFSNWESQYSLVEWTYVCMWMCVYVNVVACYQAHEVHETARMTVMLSNVCSQMDLTRFELLHFLFFQKINSKCKKVICSLCCTQQTYVTKMAAYNILCFRVSNCNALKLVYYNYDRIAEKQ